MDFKRVLSFVIVATMLLASVGCGDSTTQTSNPSDTSASSAAPSSSSEADEPTYPEWLNMEKNAIPMVNEGTEITLELMIGGSFTGTSGDPDHVWYYEYMREILNINLEVDLVLAEMDQKKNLAFNSGDLPDIFINCALTPVELVTYGTSENLLLPINEYMNEDLTPNMLDLYEVYPEYRDLITMPDGNIYAVGVNGEDSPETNEYYSPGGISDFRYNTIWFDQLQLEMPTTMDEFLDVLRAFKTLGDDIVPLGGSYAGGNTGMPIVMSALGMSIDTTERAYLEPSLREGEVTFMYGDKDVYKPFLEYFNIMFEEGLISRDYFTLDDAGQRAVSAMGNVGVLDGSTVGRLGDDEMSYGSLEPLTSTYNDTKTWTDLQLNVTNGGYAISADTEYPELAVRFLDHFFIPANAALQFVGPHDSQPELFLGKFTEGWTMNGTMGINRPWDIYADCTAWPNVFGGPFNTTQIGHAFEGTEWVAQTWESDSTGHLRRRQNIEHIVPYATTERYPSAYLYLSQDDINVITDLEGVINDYVEIEFAKFVTGARPITDEEMQIYFEGLDDLGYQEYLSIYSDYYAAFTA